MMRAIIAVMLFQFSLGIDVSVAQSSLQRQNAEAIRYAFGFFKVCKVSLYTYESLSYEDLLSGQHPSKLRLVYLRDISATDYRPNWAKALEKQNAPNSLAIMLVSILPDGVKNGAVLDFEWRPRVGLEVQLDGQSQGHLSDVRIFRAAVNTLLGPDGPGGVPEAVLGSRPTKRIE